MSLLVLAHDPPGGRVYKMHTLTHETGHGLPGVTVIRCLFGCVSLNAKASEWNVAIAAIMRDGALSTQLIRLHRTVSQTGCRRSYRSLAQNSPSLVRNLTSPRKLS